VVTTRKNRRVALVPEQSGVIASVAPGSLGAELGLEPGQRIVSINGEPLNDALDFQFAASNTEVVLEVEAGDEIVEYQVERDLDEVWGVTFADPTFDGIHICENTCPFCFIKQLPKGMRKSLYVMDDDYRYSMLYGNFVTLTNLTEADWQRIEEQRISPINVSVHATNPEVRVALVGNPKGALIMEDLARLERAGIDYNTQIVLCPGINDGVELDRTIADLVDSGPRLNSIAVVPVGLSKFGLERQSRRVRLSRTCMRTMPGATIDIRRFERDEAELVIEQIERWQARFRAERGRTFVYLGDEFYLMTGRPMPAGKFYDGFPQVEDGIGITRLFLDDAERLIKRTARGSGRGRSGTIACGTLITDTMRHLVQRINTHTGSELRVSSVENKLFGSEINVSGLLTGGDVCDVLSEERFTDAVFVSENMVSKRTKTFLDDMHIEEMQERLSRPVSAASYLSQVYERLDPASPAS
jgi:putative radical SAM enzyme (TIGR03279 family)